LWEFCIEQSQRKRGCKRQHFASPAITEITNANGWWQYIGGGANIRVRDLAVV